MIIDYHKKLSISLHKLFFKVCDEQGDFKEPLVSKTKAKEKVTEKPKTRLTRASSRLKGSKDLPGKAQVDAEQVKTKFNIICGFLKCGQCSGIL
jgi:hypothetical protein